MKKLLFCAFLLICCAGLFAGCLDSDSGNASFVPGIPEDQGEQRDWGGLSPEFSLVYMKGTEDLVIVDLRATEFYNEVHFEGAVHIPIEELTRDEIDALYMALPEGRPVISHCRRGVSVIPEHDIMKELRPDIWEISYIAGVPLFDEYNEWYAENN
ncbi:hypothetical protein MmiAt1_09930 [Methanimicrococcus sp. At1]|uniref:Rhodanese domain-containing protein n=1 Tax=Methanimicrococcus hacksteinii TaxID=3028293 RepID=A0ABU3VQH8_9EURY|nr:rhodanese-like domain-containing protein [Methanimicrococcus sp. At1]MDV0445416.1 hypothetical protein [Methanimicrococcus sp. At1]